MLWDRYEEPFLLLADSVEDWMMTRCMASEEQAARLRSKQG